MFAFLSQQEVEGRKEIVTVTEKVTLYDHAPIERVHFNAAGETLEISEDVIVIKKMDDTLSMNLAEDIRVMIFSPPDRVEEEMMIEPVVGNLDDIEIGMEVSIFGVQREDGSLVADRINLSL